MSDVGIDAAIVPWGGELSGFDAAVVRGCWDYIDARDDFLAWCESVSVSGGVPLANPAEVLRWNTDKRYLRDLAGAGVPVISTRWSDSASLEFPEGEFVVKPAVSAGARMAARHTSVQSAARHVSAIHESGDIALVQPFVPTVESVGETGTYVFGGVVSHAIRKMGILDRGAPPADSPTASSVDRVGPTPVSEELAEFALAVVAASPGPCLYARVDTVPDPDTGSPLLMELEVTEPYLFLKDQPEAAARFATATAAWLTSLA